ncbi:transposase domain-containing protein [bacterium]|nr:transposase domain-containing protein [bacterium]
MFIGGKETGWRSAVIFTFVEQVRSHGHDPFAYFEWVFEKLIHKPPEDELEGLLPEAWIEKQRRDSAVQSGDVAKVPEISHLYHLSNSALLTAYQSSSIGATRDAYDLLRTFYCKSDPQQYRFSNWRSAQTKGTFTLQFTDYIE